MRQLNRITMRKAQPVVLVFQRVNLRIMERTIVANHDGKPVAKRVV
jgi:hypothetical protein